MKQSPFLQCSFGESSYPSLDLKDMILPCSPLIGSMPLILTCYGLIETASSILICHLAGSISIWRQTALSPTATHPLGGRWGPALTPLSFFHGLSNSSGCLSVFPQSRCVNEANFSLPWCVGSLERDCKSTSEHFLVMGGVVKLHCCL